MTGQGRKGGSHRELSSFGNHELVHDPTPLFSKSIDSFSIIGITEIIITTHHIT